MSREIYQVWAPPFKWGVWKRIDILMGGPFEVTLEAESVSNVPSSFSGQVQFFEKPGAATIRTFLCPGGITFVTEADTLQQPKMRFRSHSVGQDVRVFCDIHALRNETSATDAATGSSSDFGLRDLLHRSPAEWTPDDVLRVQGSNAYQRNWEPLHEKAVRAVQQYYRVHFD